MYNWGGVLSWLCWHEHCTSLTSWLWLCRCSQEFVLREQSRQTSVTAKFSLAQVYSIPKEVLGCPAGIMGREGAVLQ